MRPRFLLVAVVALLAACSNQNKEEMLSSGVAQLQAGNIRGAVVYFKQALDLDQNFYEARYNLGEAYLKTRQYLHAEHEFEKVLRQNPDYPELLLKLAVVYRQTDRYDRALECLDLHHQKNAPTAESHDLLGVIQALQQNYSAADAHLRAAALLAPENPLPVFHLAQSLLSQSDRNQAFKVLEQMLVTYPEFSPPYELLAEGYLSENRVAEAIELYRRLFAFDPANVKALYMRGLLLITLGRSMEAQEVVDLFTTRFPEDPQGLQLQGMASYKKGEYENALVSLRHSLKRQPHSGVTYYYLGLSHFQQHEYELAINQFQRILDQQPDSSQARLMLAMTLLLQKRVDDCLQQTRYVLKINPQNGLAQNILGSAYLLQKKYDEALQAFSRAIEIDPTLVDLHLKKSQSHALRGEAEMAENELVAALVIAPYVLNTRLMLASHHLRLEQYDSAADVLKAGLCGSPSDALLYGFMAAIAGKQNKPEIALSYLQQAKIADPAYRTPYFELANYYFMQGTPDRAINEYRSLLENAPDDIQALVELGLTYELNREQALAKTTFERLKLINSPEASLEYARYQIRQGKLPLALQSLDRGLQLEGDNPDLLATKIKVLLQQGSESAASPTFERFEQVLPAMRSRLLIDSLLSRNDFAAARTLASQEQQRSSNSSAAVLLLAAVLEAEGKFLQAQELINQALLSEPRHAGLLLQSALLHEKKGDVNKAVELLQELLQQHPDYCPAKFALGTIYDRLGNRAEARRYYQDAIILNDRLVPAINNLAYLTIMEEGSPIEALSLALRAYRLSPGEAGVLDTLGMALRANGQVVESVGVLERARDLSANNPTICFHLALSYLDLQRPDSAKIELNRALHNGGFPEAAECRELLQRIKS